MFEPMLFVLDHYFLHTYTRLVVSEIVGNVRHNASARLQRW